MAGPLSEVDKDEKPMYGLKHRSDMDGLKHRSDMRKALHAAFGETS
jgi:hypothetical protein